MNIFYKKLRGQVFSVFLNDWKQEKKNEYEELNKITDSENTAESVTDEDFCSAINEHHLEKELRSKGLSGDALEDALFNYDNKNGITVSTLSKWKSGEEDISKSKYYNDAMSILDSDARKYIEKISPYFFQNVFEDEQSAVLYNYAKNEKAFTFTKEKLQDRLTLENISDDILRTCQPIKKDKKNLWCVFYREDTKKYYKASEELLSYLFDLYIESEITYYKKLTGQNRNQIKKMLNHEAKDFYNTEIDKAELLFILLALDNSLEDE